jgi:hypothetical protein
MALIRFVPKTTVYAPLSAGKGYFDFFLAKPFCNNFGLSTLFVSISLTRTTSFTRRVRRCHRTSSSFKYEMAVTPNSTSPRPFSFSVQATLQSTVPSSMPAMQSLLPFKRISNALIVFTPLFLTPFGGFEQSYQIRHFRYPTGDTSGHCGCGSKQDAANVTVRAWRGAVRNSTSTSRSPTRVGCEFTIRTGDYHMRANCSCCVVKHLGQSHQEIPQRKQHGFTFARGAEPI